MPMDKFHAYAEAMRKIIAEEVLRNLEVSIFPHIKQNAQKEIKKKYERMMGHTDKEVQRFDEAFKEIEWQMKR